MSSALPTPLATAPQSASIRPLQPADAVTAAEAQAGNGTALRQLLRGPGGRHALGPRPQRT